MCIHNKSNDRAYDACIYIYSSLDLGMHCHILEVSFVITLPRVAMILAEYDALLNNIIDTRGKS